MEKEEHRQEPDHVREIIVILNLTNSRVRVIHAPACVLIGQNGENVRRHVVEVFKNEQGNVPVETIVPLIKNINHVPMILVRLHVPVLTGPFGLPVRPRVVVIALKRVPEHVLVTQTVPQPKQNKKIVQWKNVKCHQEHHQEHVRSVIIGETGLNVLQLVMAEHKLDRDPVVKTVAKNYHNRNNVTKESVPVLVRHVVTGLNGEHVRHRVEQDIKHVSDCNVARTTVNPNRKSKIVITEIVIIAFKSVQDGTNGVHAYRKHARRNDRDCEHAHYQATAKRVLLCPAKVHNVQILAKIRVLFGRLGMIVLSRVAPV